MKFLCLGLLALAITAPATANDVYRTVNEHGVVVYSDRPLSAQSQRVRVDAKATAPQAAAPAPAPAAAPDEDTERRQREADLATLTAARAEQANIRAAACRQAQAAAKSYEESPRLFETLPDGGRRYLSDEEIVQARLEARRAVADYCVE
jgi:phage protein D